MAAANIKPTLGPEYIFAELIYGIYGVVTPRKSI